jgi:hypothetical protein
VPSLSFELKDKNPANNCLQGSLSSINQEKRNGGFYPIKVTASRSLINQAYHSFLRDANKNKKILELIFVFAYLCQPQ